MFLNSTPYAEMYRTSNPNPLKIMIGDKRDVYKFLWTCKYNTYLQKLPKEMVREIVAKIYFERNYEVDDYIDVLDTVYKWYPCIIKKVEDGKVFIHYFTWSEKWDEWIDLKSQRLAPLWKFQKDYQEHMQTHQARHACDGCKRMQKQFLEQGVITEIKKEQDTTFNFS